MPPDRSDLFASKSREREKEKGRPRRPPLQSLCVLSCLLSEEGRKEAFLVSPVHSVVRVEGECRKGRRRSEEAQRLLREFPLKPPSSLRLGGRGGW